MDAFEFIRFRLADENQRFGGGAASSVVGTVICQALAHEANQEQKRLKNGAAARTDQALLEATLTFVDQNWAEELAKAETLLSARSLHLLDERLQHAVNLALQDEATQERPVFFAVWTGVVSNFVFIAVGALVLLLVLLWSGHTLEDGIQNLIN